MKNQGNFDLLDRLYQSIDQAESENLKLRQEIDSLESEGSKIKRDFNEVQEWYQNSCTYELDYVGKLVDIGDCVEKCLFRHGGNVKRDLEIVQHLRDTNSSVFQLTNVSTGFKYVYGYDATYIRRYLHKAPVEVVDSLDRRGDLIRLDPDISNRNFKSKIKLCDEIVDFWLMNLTTNPDLRAKVDKETKEQHQRLVAQTTIRS